MKTLIFIGGSFVAIESIISNTPLQWYELVIVGGGVIGAVWVIWQKFVYPLLNILRNIEKLYPIIPKIDRIAKEFEPNGGETLRDKVMDLKGNVEDLKADFSEFKEEVYTDLDFLNRHAVRTREGKPLNVLEERQEHRSSAKGGRLSRAWKK